ncbi:peptidase domain-containing ABC transporter [Staphylococcus hominis]|uniref:peptidase domain-containing ABC transporter n=1 Tax=Staphylococcus hominis TaxID=1290 RepID=UPI00287A0FB6|nr:peptidase domain-containing ABC transporter [Staphylococcus hominis]MDS3918866.1 peptidase domain-containing ABC transporter [Staphylococcus hominis]
MRNKVPFIQQMEHSECALANIAMLLNYFGHHITLNELREAYPSSKEGYSLKNVYDILLNFGVKSKVYQLDTNDISMLNFPLICLWEDGHFIILENVKKNYYYIIDPAKGKFKLSKEKFERKFKNVVLSSEKSKTFIYKSKNKENVLRTYLKENTFGLIILLILTIVMQLFIALVPILNKNIIDFLTKKSNLNYQIFIYSTILLFMGIILISLIHTIYLSTIQYTIDKKVSKDFINHLISLPFSFFDNRSTGDLMFRANSIMHIREILSKNFISMIVDLFTILTFSVILMKFSPVISIFLFSMSLLMGGIIYASSKYLRQLVDNNIRQQVSVEGASNEIVRQNLDIKLLGIEENWSKKWNKLNLKQLKTNKKLNIFAGILESFTSSIKLIVPIFVLLLGFKLYLNNSITIGELVASSTIATTFVTPIVSLSNNYTSFLMLRGYIDRIEDVFLTKKESDKVSGKKKYISFNKSITINNLYYKYSPFDDYVLKNINMLIPKNKTIAIVGKSGSGKSTLAKIILGLLSPDSGSVKIDDENIKNFSINKYRKTFGSVLQNSSLFQDTIKENLTLGENISERRLIDIAKLTAIDSLIFAQPLGFNTIISENGNNFSGGQKQRFLLARALINYPKILVFDEATSNLDNQTESLITEYVNNLNVTKIIIAHRLSTIVDADIIYVIDNGEIKETGTHNDLIKRQGIYSTLYGKENNI